MEFLNEVPSREEILYEVKKLEAICYLQYLDEGEMVDLMKQLFSASSDAGIIINIKLAAQTVLDNLKFCPICETYHINNTLCQVPDPHECGDHFPE